MDDVGAVGALQRLAHVVVGDQDRRCSALAQAADQGLDLLHGDRIDAGEGLVEQQDRGVASRARARARAAVARRPRACRPMLSARCAISSSCIKSSSPRPGARLRPNGMASSTASRLSRTDSGGRRSAPGAGSPCRGARAGTSADASIRARAAAPDPRRASSGPTVMRKLVVLPAPFGPSRPTISPACTSKETPSTTRRFLKALTRPLTSSRCWPGSSVSSRRDMRRPSLRASAGSRAAELPPRRPRPPRAHFTVPSSSCELDGAAPGPTRNPAGSFFGLWTSCAQNAGVRRGPGCARTRSFRLFGASALAGRIRPVR